VQPAAPAALPKDVDDLTDDLAQDDVEAQLAAASNYFRESASRAGVPAAVESASPSID
jgi:hypothetical protein